MMKTDTPLTDDGPCDCDTENRELEEVEQRSILTGAMYNTIRCENCKDVFAAEPKNDCSCGGVGEHAKEHLQWCEESSAEWPPLNTDQSANKGSA